jgi:hypothetical protein
MRTRQAGPLFDSDDVHSESGIVACETKLTWWLVHCHCAANMGRACRCELRRVSDHSAFFLRSKARATTDSSSSARGKQAENFIASAKTASS